MSGSNCSNGSGIAYSKNGSKSGKEYLNAIIFSFFSQEKQPDTKKSSGYIQGHPAFFTPHFPPIVSRHHAEEISCPATLRSRHGNFRAALVSETGRMKAHGAEKSPDAPEEESATGFFRYPDSLPPSRGSG
jgi:hypothetical protein